MGLNFRVFEMILIFEGGVEMFFDQVLSLVKIFCLDFESIIVCFFVKQFNIGDEFQKRRIGIKRQY